MSSRGPDPPPASRMAHSRARSMEHYTTHVHAQATTPLRHERPSREAPPGHVIDVRPKLSPLATAARAAAAWAVGFPTNHATNARRGKRNAGAPPPLNRAQHAGGCGGQHREHGKWPQTEKRTVSIRPYALRICAQVGSATQTCLRQALPTQH